MKTIIAMFALALSACVSTSEVIPAGHDYLVTSFAKGGMNSGKGVIEATQKANAYCANLGKTMVIRSSGSHGDAGFNGESGQLVFGCE